MPPSTQRLSQDVSKDDVLHCFEESIIPSLSEDDDKDSHVVAAPPIIAASDLPQRGQVRRQVSFKSIQVREYERVLGDHPNAREGPPIAIGWAFVEHDALDLGQYEEDCKRKKKGRLVPVVPAATRRRLLRDIYNYTEKELCRAEHEVFRTCRERFQTVQRCGTMEEKCEEVNERVHRFAKKLLRNLVPGGGNQLRLKYAPSPDSKRPAAPLRK